MSDLEDDAEPPKPRRTTSLVTYEALAGIREGLLRAIMGIERMEEKLTENTSATRETLIDHEARLRSLEASRTEATGASGALRFAYQAIWPLASFAFGLLVYLTSK